MSNKDEGEVMNDPEESLNEDNVEDEAPKVEYKKKEFFAQPYKHDGVTEAAVNAEIVQNSRPRIKTRMVKPRREFGLENHQMIEKDAGDATADLKHTAQKGGSIQTIKKKKVLHMGLQAARGIQSFRQNTYHRMSVNASVQYRADDFIDAIRQQSLSQGDINEKLDRFINRVQYKVEEALQSNELINVFQDDFEMIGDEEAAVGQQSSALNMVPRSFFEQEYCKSKTVSCIRFHPTKDHLVAMSLVERFNNFEDRVNLLGISFDAYVLILNFKDPHIITLNYILQTPVEITSFEFHPENPNVVIGGAINGQVVCWDLASINHRITSQGGRKPTVARMPDEEEDKTQQTAVKLKQLILSNIERSHKSYVSDIHFVPKNVKVDKRAGITGRQDFFMSCSEDGWFHIWDTRSVTVDELAKQTKRFEWMPLLSVNVHRQDGSGEVGLSKLLFKSDQETPTFYATSDEGDLMLIDWSIKPVGDDNAKIAENVRMTRDSERSYRPTLALERSPFFDDLVMTIHDFHFAIWKTSIATQETPIYRSCNTFTSHNTCGAFSPTRPGVIFITKTDGIDIWDFLDQSNKPSMTISFATAPITYFRFQNVKLQKGKKAKQYMAYGDHLEGTLFLYEVPPNLAYPQEDERRKIQEFWDNEIAKCDFVSERRVQMKEAFAAEETAKAIALAKEEAEKDKLESADLEKEQADEEAYQAKVVAQKFLLGQISEEEHERLQNEMKKKKAQ